VPSIKEDIIEGLRTFCRKIKPDDYPQIDVNEFLRNNLTLADVYFPFPFLRHKTFRLCYEDECRMDFPPELFSGSSLGIVGERGSGKTIFCRRLTLAIIDKDLSFFETQRIVTDQFENAQGSWIPLLVECKLLNDLAEHCPVDGDLMNILWSYYSNTLESFDHTIEEFRSFVLEEQKNRFTLIIDGWDDLSFGLDGMQGILQREIRRFFSQNNRDGVIVTTNRDDTLPVACYSHSPTVWYIPHLFPDEARAFFEAFWFYGSDPTSEERRLCSELFNQLCGPRALLGSEPISIFALAEAMGIIRQDNIVPSNKAGFLHGYFQRRIYNATGKPSCLLSKGDILPLLSYIALDMVLQGKRECDIFDLAAIVARGKNDLCQRLSDKALKLSPDDIISALTQTELISSTINRRQYHFSNGPSLFTNMGAPFGMDIIQKFLAAVAIDSGYVRKEYYLTSRAELAEKICSPVGSGIPCDLIPFTVWPWTDIALYCTLLFNERDKSELLEYIARKAEIETSKDIIFVQHMSFRKLLEYINMVSDQ